MNVVIIESNTSHISRVPQVNSPPPLFENRLEQGGINLSFPGSQKNSRAFGALKFIVDFDGLWRLRAAGEKFFSFISL